MEGLQIMTDELVKTIEETVRDGHRSTMNEMSVMFLQISKFPLHETITETLRHDIVKSYKSSRMQFKTNGRNVKKNSVFVA